MTKWTYRIVLSETDVTEEWLNREGWDGWELVSETRVPLNSDTTGWRLVLKRHARTSSMPTF